MGVDANPSMGYAAAFIAIVCFGSNFVFAKGIELGDGVFFQFVMCVAIWCTSIPVLMQEGSFPATTREFSIAMIGGCLWCTGNMMCGPIIQLIGLGMGLILWGSTNMLTGWASGTFGLFGLTAEEVAKPSLNFAGVGLAVVGLVLYLQVRPNETPEGMPIKEEVSVYGAVHGEDDLESPLQQQNHQQRTPATSTATDATVSSHSGPYFSADGELTEAALNLRGGVAGFGKNKGGADPFSALTATQRRLLGFSMAIVTGMLFGCSFNPSQYVIDKESADARETNLVFVFPQFCGILLTSVVYTVTYMVYKIYYLKQTPYVRQELLLPGFCSGLVWGIANIAWFVANQNLGFSISFPLITSGPGFIGALWGIFKFGEIRGERNFRYLGGAFAVTLPALIMVGLSHSS